MDELRATLSAEGNLAIDWDFEGEEFDEESKLCARDPQDRRAARASDQCYLRDACWNRRGVGAANGRL
jgi:hypothetical protein